MPIRLNKVATEFHITLNEIASFLKEKYGICVTSLNDTITEEQYAEMCAHYRKDKVYHEAIRKKAYNVWKKEKRTFTEEEIAVMEEYGTMRPHQKTLESKKYELKVKKGKALPKRKGGKSSSWLGNFKGYMRIVSVPFGGMKKR